jgi:hypothetical protein
MFKIEQIAKDAIKITATQRLSAESFSEIAALADPIIGENGQIRVLIDVTALQGWENFAAFKRHLGFVASHQGFVLRLAIITSRAWQRALAKMAGLFLHPDIRAFSPRDAGAACRWLL